MLPIHFNFNLLLNSERFRDDPYSLGSPCFRIMRYVTEEEDEIKANTKGRIQAVILDMSSEFYNLSKHSSWFDRFHSLNKISLVD